MKKHVTAGAIAALAFAAAGSAQAAVINLDFEGINSTYPSGFAFVQGFYNGGTSSDGTSGPNLGVEFPDNAQAICLNTPGTTCSNTSRGGLGDATSQLGGLFFLSGTSTFLNYAAGFTTGFSFNYTAVNQGGAVQVYDGLNGTGTLLATVNLLTTAGGCDASFSAAFCPFFPAGVAFAGTAKSISFNGVANQIVFDDVTFGSDTPGGTPTPRDVDVPEPGTMLLLGAGLIGLAAMARRRRKSA